MVNTHTIVSELQTGLPEAHAILSEIRTVVESQEGTGGENRLMSTVYIHSSLGNLKDSL